MSVPASERQLMGGRVGGKEQNMMSSLGTHPSELSGCSKSAIYFINIIPSGLTSWLPWQHIPKLPVLFTCLKPAHTKEKVLIKQEARGSSECCHYLPPLLKPQDQCLQNQTQTRQNGVQHREAGTPQGKLSPVRSCDE